MPTGAATQNVDLLQAKVREIKAKIASIDSTKNREVDRMQKAAENQSIRSTSIMRKMLSIFDFFKLMEVFEKADNIEKMASLNLKLHKQINDFLLQYHIDHDPELESLIADLTNIQFQMKQVVTKRVVELGGGTNIDQDILNNALPKIKAQKNTLNKHAVGIIQYDKGILFHDTDNGFTFHFADKGSEQFKQFLSEYQKLYPGLVIISEAQEKPTPNKLSSEDHSILSSYTTKSQSSTTPTSTISEENPPSPPKPNKPNKPK